MTVTYLADIKQDNRLITPVQSLCEAIQEIELPANVKTKFVGYETLETDSKIVGILQDDKLVNAVKTGSECWIITDKTPFFAATGGQVDDQGIIDFGLGVSAKALGLKKLSGAIAVKIFLSIFTPVSPLDINSISTKPGFPCSSAHFLNCV